MVEGNNEFYSVPLDGVFFQYIRVKGEDVQLWQKKSGSISGYHYKREEKPVLRLLQILDFQFIHSYSKISLYFLGFIVI